MNRLACRLPSVSMVPGKFLWRLFGFVGRKLAARFSGQLPHCGAGNEKKQIERQLRFGRSGAQALTKGKMIFLLRNGVKFVSFR
ncbi:hypothetical protein CEXT_158541 [Caerostris extrusa]|uniref:Uncharacterized protein n=1 Tax=Caerostris extrusa TaxID=172846 RepID=A0AAV4UPC7_CAEEX|nr:hypothetical protein CEXT_158541 [Caerostris extrusa]